jgi:hypothetical protein
VSSVGPRLLPVLFLTACFAGPEGDAPAGTSGVTRTGDVTIDERACSLVVGKATPIDVIELYGWPITRGWNGQTAVSSLVYMHRDPSVPVPEIVYFMFRRRGDRSPERLIGAIRTTGPGPYGFSCFRDMDGNEVQPIGLAP